MTDTHTDTYQFQAETRQLLDLVINSLYTHKEIFLRELISNASDALDRRRFEALTRPEVGFGDVTPEIRLEVDGAARTLAVHDTGVGMSREEVIEHLGTIAKSGTRELVRRAAEEDAANGLNELIGQFGVGFYSAFMVAREVVVVTRRVGEDAATVWRSAGDGEYTVADGNRALAGTTVTLRLKDADEEDGLEDYTDPAVLRRIVRRYSDFVTYPVVMKSERPGEGDDAPPVVEDTTLNSMKPIWTRPASEVSEEEYAEFYRHIAHDWTEPAKTLSFKAEGRVEYQALVFIPKQLPFMWDPRTYGLQLYSRRVMIMERCEDVLPPYLRFVKGVVDASDLPLNVSREMLQHDRHIVQIRRWLTKKILDALVEMADREPEQYTELWSAFGRVLKEGVAGDADNRDRIVRLLRFPSSNDPSEATSLADYVGRMKEGQEAIYVHTGESRKAIESSPHLEAFRERGYEVLYLDDPVDELVLQWVPEFEGKALRSAAKGEVDLGGDEASAEEEQGDKEAFGELLGALGKLLDEEVKEVRLSHRLTTSPACLVGEEHDLSPQLEKILRAAGQEAPHQKRILELNPKHAVVEKLRERFAADADDPVVGEYARLLLGYAQLAEGSDLTDASEFNRRLAELMTRALG